MVIKPSEIATATATAMEKLVKKYENIKCLFHFLQNSYLGIFFCRFLDPDTIQVVNGGIPETTALLKEKFDHIFFTGGTNVGKVVAEAASKQLTPCTLELGGKCPLYIDDSVNLLLAAKRLVWGKMINLGQTCVAPE